MKNIIVKSLITCAIFAMATGVAQAVSTTSVSLVVAPASLSEKLGNTFTTSIVVKTGGDIVYAVEGTLSLDGLSCQNIKLAEGLIPQSTPTCEKPYFLVGIPSGTSHDLEIIQADVRAMRIGNAELGISGVDVIGKGFSLSSISTSGVYLIEKAIQQNIPSHETTIPVSQEITIQPIIDDIGSIKKETRRGIATTQLANIANIIEGNSIVFIAILVLIIVLGYRYVKNRHNDRE